MKRTYPLFLVDRSRIPGHEYDFVICTDREYGYIARVVQLRTNELLEQFEQEAAKIPNSDISNYVIKLKTGGLALVVEDFLYYFDITDEARVHLHSMLKKGMKKYFYSTKTTETDGVSFGLDQQILQQRQSIARARSNYEDLVRRSSKEEADYAIALAQATLNTLVRCKEVEDSLEY